MNVTKAMAAILATQVFTLNAVSADTTANLYREEIIVTATRIPMAAKNVGSSVTVFTAEDIQARKVPLTADLLREVPGLAINRAGQTGAVTQARIRGAEGNHTLVLIDGIEANNPALGFEFNFADLLTNDIQRIEVLRGPQSALYGSEAIGGVIAINTKGRDVPGFGFSSDISTGSYGTNQYAASVSAATDSTYLYVSGIQHDTDGVSASAIQSERDPFESRAWHAKLGGELPMGMSWQAVWRHVDSDVHVDTQDFVFPPTPTQGLVIDSNQVTESKQKYARLQLGWQSADDRWQQKLAFNLTDAESDAYQDRQFDNGNEGRREKWEYQGSYLFGQGDAQHAITLGAQHEDLEFENNFPSFFGATYKADDQQLSWIAEYSYVSNTIGLSLSSRYDDNDLFESATSVRLAGAYLWQDQGTRLHFAVGQGVTNPSFFEMFGFSPSSFVGNPDLDPESSNSFEVGLEQSLYADQLIVDLTFFKADLQDEIVSTFDGVTFLSSVENQRGESDREGIELSAQARLSENLNAQIGYTYLDASEPSGSVEVRRPRHSASFSGTYQFAQGKALANLSATYNGSQHDSEFIFATPATTVDLDAYTLINLSLSYSVSEQIEVYMRGSNLLDEDYQEVFGYRSVGRAGMFGVQVNF